ncbi:MAG: hypothetical protein QW176_01675 [Candidatus Bathyarchaeia archaeon]
MRDEASSPPRGILRKALLEAVDGGLLALGRSVREAVYRHMDKRYSVARDEIPDRPGEFAEALRDMLGAGAEVLLKFMARRFYAKLGLRYEEKPGWNFKEYVEYARVEGHPPPNSLGNPPHAGDPWPPSLSSHQLESSLRWRWG